MTVGLYPLPSKRPESTPGDVQPKSCEGCGVRGDLTVTLQHGYRCRLCGHPGAPTWSVTDEGGDR